MSTPFWLSHHRRGELHRTYEIAGFRVCARCLGTYPILATFVAAQFAANAPLDWRYDGPWALGLMAPAVADWAIGRFRPHWGPNLLRTATGVLLGLALGRTLYVHFQRPWPVWLVAQCVLVTAVAVPVILARARRKKG